MPFNIALNGLQAAQKDLQAIGNDIANAETTGYKEARTEFSDVIAASLLGASATAIGTGVRLSAVTQQFTQGTVTFTDNNLDMAVNGQGFFRLNDGGATVYSRAGAFGVDRNGFIVNSSGKRLTGFLADTLGNITGAQGDLEVSSANLSPRATTDVDITLNLDSTKTPPASPWLGTSAFGGAPPLPNTYNDASSTTIYDSLGNSHILTTYYLKTSTANNWDIRVQIDGVEVSTTTPKSTSVVTDATPLSTSGTLLALGTGDLTLNGTAVIAAVTDGVSSTDVTASALATTTAINAGTGTHGVTATVVATTLNMGTYNAGILSSTDFQINGSNVVVGTASQASLLTAINALTGTTGVSAAADTANIITFTAADGRNIQVEADGTATTATFSNFTLQTASDQVQRGTVTVSSTGAITIAGTAPTDVGLANRIVYPPFRIVFNTDGSYNASLSETLAISWTPLDAVGANIGAASPQAFTIDPSTTTQYGTAFAVQALTQDGFTTGRINGLDVDGSGLLFARYTNGQSRALGQVVLANFSNPQGLSQQGDTTWAETFASGTALVRAPGTASLGTVQSGGLEDSNVKLTEELVQLIVAQRNFQANAQTIRTADAVTQTIINIR